MWDLTAAMLSKRAKTKKHPQCTASSVVSKFTQSQIQEFREAFNRVYLAATMDETPDSTNFTMFLTMFGEKLNGADPEDVIRNAFAPYFEQLATRVNRFAEEAVQGLYRVASIDKKGGFHYIAFMRIRKHGAKDQDN
ncbi:hypothetical protein FD754_016521 [Muntiacus muntjak]|uniref:Uncharacterized protein n=1 Tax=Muntiacus muntjak TaxID=9888 RepID=A0A5N3VR93_MUNMU|nr:hypothetical protein FD754_016521 [Muntiacus muntjak]